MKKILIFASFLGSLLTVSTAFAQIEPAGTSTVPAEILPVASASIDLEKLDHRYNALLEFFIQKTKEQDFEIAYGYMAGNFPKMHPLKDFKRIMAATGLSTFTEKKWTYFDDQMKSIGVTTVKGEFTTPDQVVHEVTFYVIIGGETEIKIGEITETLKVADLPKLFPQTAALHKLVLKDLRAITKFIRKNQSKNAFNYLSAPAKIRTTVKAVRKMFAQFKRKKLDVSLPKQGQIILDEGFPAVSADGLMTIQGAYQNAKNTVRFVLAYDYDNWQWKLGVFSLGAQPVPAPQ